MLNLNSTTNHIAYETDSERRSVLQSLIYHNNILIIILLLQKWIQAYYLITIIKYNNNNNIYIIHSSLRSVSKACLEKYQNKSTV